MTINEYKLSKEKSKLNIYLMNDMTILTRSKQKSTGIMRSKKDIELFIGIIHLRDILELLTVGFWVYKAVDNAADQNDSIILPTLVSIHEFLSNIFRK